MKPKPTFQPLSMLPVIQELILSTIDDINNFYETMLIAKSKPYSLDDFTVNRIKSVYIEHKEYILIYKKQLEKWKAEERLTNTQRTLIDRLYKELKPIYKKTKEILEMADYCESRTIEKILSKDEGELALEHLLGMFDLDDD